MFKNYFVTAWRNLIRNKAFTTINILGLALGMACSLLILLWIRDERSIDGFHAHGKQLFQVYERSFFDGKVQSDYPTQALMAAELKRQIPEIEYSSSLEWNQLNTFETAKKINKMTGSYAGADFFTMFSFPLLEGTPQSALNSLEGIAISRKMADQFFGSPRKAIGQTIRYENSDNFVITAVFEDLPANSSMQFDFLRSWKAFEKDNDNWMHNWGNTDPQTYVQLKAGADPAKVEASIKDFIYRFKDKSTAHRVELALQPFPDKYLNSNFKNGFPDGGRIEYVHLFSLVALFILLIACINFINLATAQSAKRAREVGVRKVIGADRFGLILQFIGEAIILALISILVSLVLVAILLPAFNQLTGKQIELPWQDPLFWISLAALLIVAGVFSGAYPAFFLSSLNPVSVLKGRLAFNWKSAFFRKGLVVFQFSLSIILIIAMTVIYRQVSYIQTTNIGYDRENLVYIPLEGEIAGKYGLFKESIRQLPGVAQVSKMRVTPTVIGNHTGDVFWPGMVPNTVVSFVNSDVGYDFVKTMNLKLVAGRDFSTDYGTDSAAFLVNEAAVRKIGWKDGVGQNLTWGKQKGKVIGVLKDFQFASFQQSIEPMIIRLNEPRDNGSILVRIRAGQTRKALADLEKAWKEMNPKFPFTYQFSDEAFSRLYKSDEVVSRLSNYFAFLAIFISCLGLFGLATFTALQRTKEIGIRKTLGASVPGIVRLLSVNFLRPVIISLFIAFPIAWFAMKQWLLNYAYKIDLEWWMFAGAGLLTVVIALVTVSYQSIRAARVNPVVSLKSE